jgi:hypothetical protein
LSLSLEIVLGFRGIPAGEVWRLLRESQPTSMGDTAPCRIDQRKANVGDVAKAIEASGRDHFEVEIGGGVITYGHAANFAVSLVFVENFVSDEANAETWVRPFLALPSFRQARVYDHDYEHWQNAEDPLHYRVAGKSYEHLPMRSNGLPPPLEQMVIDISRNPGRREIRQGFVEFVGSVMWLGESFWPAAGVKKDRLRAQSWLQVDELPSGTVRIRAAAEPFTTSAGQAGDIQGKLRALLYASSSLPVSA